MHRITEKEKKRDEMEEMQSQVFNLTINYCQRKKW